MECFKEVSTDFFKMQGAKFTIHLDKFFYRKDIEQVGLSHVITFQLLWMNLAALGVK